MTDIVTEFINVNNLKYQDLLAGVTIVNNSATECAVLKDVVVSNPSGRLLDLVVGSSRVATVMSDSRLSGTELLPVNAKLQLKTRAPAMMNEFYSAGNQTALVRKFRSPTLFGDNVTEFFSAQVPNPVTSQFASTITFMCFDSGGNFYYATHNIAVLYKRSGGVNGAQTSYAFGSLGFCFDGARYIHAFSGNSVFTFDTVDAAITSKVCGVGITANQCYASAIDGWIYVRPNIGEINYLVHALTGNKVPAPGVLSEYGMAFYVGIGKDSKGNYICWQTSYPHPLFYWWNIGPTLSAPLVRKSGSSNDAFASKYSTTNGITQATRQAGSDSIFYVIGDSVICHFDIETKIITRLPDPGALSEGPSFVPIVNQVFASEDFGTVGIRATGIKTSY